MPRFVADIESWANAVMHRTAPVDAAEIRRCFVDPLMAQVYTDAGEQIAKLAEGRLRLDGSGATVRQVARRMGLTRARVYQLLGDISAGMSVRWPDGYAMVQNLRNALHEQVQDARELELFDAVVELFFPNSRQEGIFDTEEPQPLKVAVKAHMDG